MKISSISNPNKQISPGRSFRGSNVGRIVLPEFIGKVAKVVGSHVNTPEQKLFLASSSLLFTPFIDLKYAREDQKTDAAVKSASKAIAGGVTGVTIRAGFTALTSHFIGIGKNNPINNCFFPESASNLLDKAPELAERRLNQYCKTLGTLFAVIFMILFSNNKLDVPLTSDLQDLITGVVKEDKSWFRSFNDVVDDRKNKIKDWFKSKKDIFKNIKNKFSEISKVIKEKNTDTSTAGAKDKK